jgi:hypothetical protein
MKSRRIASAPLIQMFPARSSTNPFTVVENAGLSKASGWNLPFWRSAMPFLPKAKIP